MNEARLILAAFPEVKQVVSQVGRPYDGTDRTGFLNTEYYVDLKPKDQWRPVFKEDKEALIAAMDTELSKISGVLWNFSQPISDNMEEAVSGVKGELAVKMYGDDLKLLEQKGEEIVNVMRGVQGVEDLGLFRVLGQPNLNLSIDRQKAARYGINVVDVQGLWRPPSAARRCCSSARRAEVRPGGAVPGALSGHPRGDRSIRLLAPSESASPWRSCRTLDAEDGASEIYREATHVTSRSSTAFAVAISGSAVEEAMHKVDTQVKLPVGYHLDWAGEYESQKRSQRACDDRAHHRSGHLHHPLQHVSVAKWALSL